MIHLISFSSDKTVIAAVASSLSSENLDTITATGQYNHLYFLNKVNWTQIDGEIKSEIQDALKNIKARNKSVNSAVGPKAMELVTSIESKL